MSLVDRCGDCLELVPRCTCDPDHLNWSTFKPVPQPCLPDVRYVRLHQKCAAGTITEDERAELDLIQAEKEREWLEIHGEAA